MTIFLFLKYSYLFFENFIYTHTQCILIIPTLNSLLPLPLDLPLNKNPSHLHVYISFYCVQLELSAMYRHLHP